MDAATDWVVNAGRYALDFDGVDDTVDCGTGVNADPAGLTISAWVNSSNWGSAGGLNGVFAAKGTLNGDATSTYALYWNSSFGWTFFTLSSANVLSIVRDNTAATANKIFHIVGTATASTLSIYINGQLKSTAANSGGNIKTSAQTLNLGSDGATRRLFGNLFDLAIWRRSLTANEIAELYQIGRGGMYAPRRRRKVFIEVGGPVENVVLLSDTLGVGDEALQRRVLTRLPSDNIQASDAVLTRALRTRAATDSIDINDQSVSRALRNRTIVEAVTASDAVARAAVRQRVLAEAVSALDDAQRFAVRGRTTTETVAAFDSAEKRRLLFRRATDMLEVIDELDSSVIFSATYGTRIRIGSSRSNVAVLGGAQAPIVLGGYT